MKPEDYSERQVDTDGWQVNLTTYQLGEKWYTKADNVSPGAALARPESRVISWCGDGGLSMTSYVLPTVAEHQLPITFVVIDDGATVYLQT